MFYLFETMLMNLPSRWYQKLFWYVGNKIYIKWYFKNSTAIIVGNGKNSRSPEVGKNTLTVWWQNIIRISFQNKIRTDWVDYM